MNVRVIFGAALTAVFLLSLGTIANARPDSLGERVGRQVATPNAFSTLPEVSEKMHRGSSAAIPPGQPDETESVPVRTCARGRSYQIVSFAAGTVVHRWINGPPHLGYRWHEVVAGRHWTIWDNRTTIGQRSVYNAQVSVWPFNGRDGQIDHTESRCVDGG
jgi:hypothetical protein